MKIITDITTLKTRDFKETNPKKQNNTPLPNMVQINFKYAKKEKQYISDKRAMTPMKTMERCIVANRVPRVKNPTRLITINKVDITIERKVKSKGFIFNMINESVRLLG